MPVKIYRKNTAKLYFLLKYYFLYLLFYKSSGGCTNGKIHDQEHAGVYRNRCKE